MQAEAQSLREQAQKVASSGALGRSRSYSRLLEFLVDCAVGGRTPKELEIAMEVFGKGADFDPSQDSMVRVYAHNLRQKLEHYYATEGRAEPQQIALARGEYRVSLLAGPAAGPSPAQNAPAAGNVPASLAGPASGPEASASPRPVRAPWRPVAAIMGVLALGILLGFGIAVSREPAPPPAAAVAAAPIWAGLLKDDMPILIVVGDYYIFGEMDEHGDVQRLVRDFNVGSRAELDELMKRDPKVASKYMNLDLTYLPTGSAFALLDVLRVLYTSEKPVRVVSMSEMSDTDLKTSHVVYLGYISGLGKLEDFVFASSSLAIGYTYDELRNTETGETYASEAGMPESNRNYRDYALISTFPGPGGNQFLIVAGTRDAGMMQAAHALTDPMLVRSVEQARPDQGSGQRPSFEMLYEVSGYGSTNLDAKLVHAGKLNYQEIWGGNLLHAHE
ncbi:MAG TPA: hypothetical protein VHH11_14345 [Gammaproteobacteria bacterium]|jgi:hypothetical protein|nr:hypothetical protein [Gammaproteobacteria bacterium]